MLEQLGLPASARRTVGNHDVRILSSERGLFEINRGDLSCATVSQQTEVLSCYC